MRRLAEGREISCLVLSFSTTKMMAGAAFPYATLRSKEWHAQKANKIIREKVTAPRGRADEVADGTGERRVGRTEASIPSNNIAGLMKLVTAASKKHPII